MGRKKTLGVGGGGEVQQMGDKDMCVCRCTTHVYVDAGVVCIRARACVCVVGIVCVMECGKIRQNITPTSCGDTTPHPPCSYHTHTL